MIGGGGGGESGAGKRSLRTRWWLGRAPGDAEWLDKVGEHELNPGEPKARGARIAAAADPLAAAEGPDGSAEDCVDQGPRGDW